MKIEIQNKQLKATYLPQSKCLDDYNKCNYYS